MNTFWIKIAGVAIGILIIIVVVSMFMPGGDNEPATAQSPNKPTNFYDQAREDRKNLIPSQEEETAISNQTPDSNVQEQEPNNNVPSPAVVVAQPAPVQPPQSNEITIYVKPLTESEKAEAEREINYEAPMYSIGRLPMTSYKPAIDSARRILSRWPDSIYAYKAKEMLAKIPERFYSQYHITPEELDTSMFLTSKAGTVPVKVKIEGR